MLNLQAVIVLKGACTGSTQSCIYAAAACVDALRHGVARVWRIPLIRSHRYNLFGTYAGAVFLQILPICHSQVRLTNDFTSLCARARRALARRRRNCARRRLSSLGHFPAVWTRTAAQGVPLSWFRRRRMRPLHWQGARAGPGRCGPGFAPTSFDSNSAATLSPHAKAPRGGGSARRECSAEGEEAAPAPVTRSKSTEVVDDARNGGAGQAGVEVFCNVVRA